MSQITYVKGDATDPQGRGLKIIAHIVNNKGGWGKGFVVPLAEKYPHAESSYRAWAKGHTQGSLFNGHPEFALGHTQFVVAGDHVMVANMCAQDGYRKRYDDEPKRYVSYEALGECLRDVFSEAKNLNASIHMPRIGTGLGGGDWEEIERMIDLGVRIYDVDVTVYDL